MKIGWYLQSNQVRNAEDILLYNPGMSGAEYKTFELIRYMSECHNIKQVLFSNYTHSLWKDENSIEQICCGDIFTGADEAEKNKCDIYIFGYWSEISSNTYKII